MDDERLRIDRWLWCARFYKTRSLAADAVSAGHARINGERVKPARALKSGDRVTIRRGAVDFDCTVLLLPNRRGPAPEAAACYEELPESIQRREAYAAQARLAAASAPTPDHKPDKHDRRALRQARGRH